MSGWSNGTFTRVHDWSSDAAAGIDILASRMDAEDDNFEGGIHACIHKGGQNSAIANLPMGGNRHTNVGDAEGRDQYARADQVQDGDFWWGGTSGGSANAQTLTGVGGNVAFSTTYPAGGIITFIAGFSNTGAMTLSVNGGDADNVYYLGAAMTGGEVLVGEVVVVVHDGTRWHKIGGGAAGAVGFAPLADRLLLTGLTTAVNTNTTYYVDWDIIDDSWDDIGSWTTGSVLTIPTDGRYNIEAGLKVAEADAVSQDCMFTAWLEWRINSGGSWIEIYASKFYVPFNSSITLGSIAPVLHPRVEMELEEDNQIRCCFQHSNGGDETFRLYGEGGDSQNCSYLILRRTG